MRYIILTIYGLTVLLLSSCATVNIPNDFDSLITRSNIHEIEGTYKNVSIDNKIPLWLVFCDNLNETESIAANDTTAKFTVKLLPNEKIKFELYSKEKLKITNVLDYSFDEGGIAIKGKSNYTYFGVPLIFYRYASIAIWFSKDNDHELFLSCNGNVSGGFFIFIFTTPQTGKYRYKQIRKY